MVAQFWEPALGRKKQKEEEEEEKDKKGRERGREAGKGGIKEKKGRISSSRPTWAMEGRVGLVIDSRLLS